MTAKDTAHKYKYSDGFVSSISRSMTAFEEVVKPELVRELGGDFISVETVGKAMSPIRHALDTKAGIDLLYVKGDVLGVANRVQFGPRSFDTFTIRMNRDGQDPNNTEYAKRKRAIERGYLYPTLTIQSYVGDATGVLWASGVVRTKDLIDAIDNGVAEVQHTSFSKCGQAAFYVVRWCDLGDKVKVIRPGGGGVITMPIQTNTIIDLATHRKWSSGPFEQNSVKLSDLQEQEQEQTNDDNR